MKNLNQNLHRIKKQILFSILFGIENMSELKIKFIYNGEESFLNFLNLIKFDVEDKFDKHVWNGEIKIGKLVFLEKEKDFAGILFKIFFSLQEKKGVSIEMNLWYKP